MQRSLPPFLRDDGRISPDGSGNAWRNRTCVGWIYADSHAARQGARFVDDRRGRSGRRKRLDSDDLAVWQIVERAAHFFERRDRRP